MAADELETIPIHDKEYVTLAEAARYLDISRDYLTDLILLGKIEAVQIESHQFIELETLKVYAESRKQKKQSAWDRLDEWRGHRK